LRLASASSDRIVKIWDATLPQESLPLREHDGLYSPAVTFSPDGKRLASGSVDGTVKIWDTASRQVIRTIEAHTGRVHCVAFSRDGKRLASGGDDQMLKVWDPEAGALICVLPGHSKPAMCVTFDANGTRLVSGGQDGCVKVWDLKSGRWERDVVVFNPGWIKGVAFSPDGKWLAVGSPAPKPDVTLWDTTTWELVRTFEGHTYSVFGVAFSPDGERLATGSQDTTARIWNVATAEQIYLLEGHTGTVEKVAFSADGKRLASAGYGHMRIWDALRGEEILSLEGSQDSFQSVAFSPDGYRIAATDGVLRLWDGRPWDEGAAAQLSAEREASGALDCLFGKPLCKTDVNAYLACSPTISAGARQKALELAKRYHEETNPEAYHQASWSLVRQGALNGFQYRFALLQALTACRLAPQQGMYRTTLGAAQYRACQYEQALATLTHAEPLHRAAAASLVAPSPALLSVLAVLGQADQLRQTLAAHHAFLALTYHQLGQKEEARRTLASLREVREAPAWGKDTATLSLVREVEEVIDAGARKGQ
jgi:WD40 repeat protein